MFKRKIPCYILIYKELEIIKKSLNFFTQLSNFIDIIVIENPSNNSLEIKSYVQELGNAKKISRYYIFEKNITNNAFDIVIQNEIKNIKSSRFIIVSDGDLTVNDGTAWLEETLSIMDKPDVFCCGCSLLTDNLPVETFPEAMTWIPRLISIGDFSEGRTGCHLLTMRGKDMAKFIEWKTANNGHFTDNEIYRFCYQILHKKWARTSKNMAYHLTWDLYSDLNNEYTKLKTNKSFKDTWYHNESANFTLLKY